MTSEIIGIVGAVLAVLGTVFASFNLKTLTSARLERRKLIVGSLLFGGILVGLASFTTQLLIQPERESEKETLQKEIAARLAAEDALQKAILQVQELRHQINPAVTPTPTITPQSIRGRVYIFLASESQRQLGIQMRDAFSRQGFTIPGIQSVAGKGFVPDMVEVRYLLHPQDRDLAKEVLDILRNELHVTNARLSYTVKGPSDRPGHIEVWLSRSVERQ